LAIHPALHSWRDELPSAFVRILAYMGGIAVLSIAAAHVIQSPSVMSPITPAHQSDWIEIERPFPAFVLYIPEATDVPAGYAIRRHVDGGGRKDILTRGESDGTTPYLRVEIYRPGSEIDGFGPLLDVIAVSAATLGPINVSRDDESLDSKFGSLAVVNFATSIGPPRQCLAFVRAYSDPRLQLSGWFCQSGAVIERVTLACALDRLTLLAAGSEPKIGALFAQAELNRSYCGQRSSLLAPTPKHKALWGKNPAR
jgi:hypothetical protein